MNHKIFMLSGLLTLAILTSGCGSNEEGQMKDTVAREYYKHGGVKVEAEVKDDTILHGLYKKFTPDGYLEAVYTYVEGKREGPAVTYYNNGQLRTKLTYRDNKPDGTAKMYYKTGELYRTTDYSQGKITGIRTTYYKNGRVMSKVPYMNNYPGTGIREFDENGRPENDLPSITITPVNKLALEDKYILKIALSRPQRETTFYLGELEEGQYLSSSLWPHKPDGGTYDYVVRLHKGGFMMETITISALFRTDHNSWAVVSRSYNLAIDNK